MLDGGTHAQGQTRPEMIVRYCDSTASPEKS